MSPRCGTEHSALLPHTLGSVHTQQHLVVVEGGAAAAVKGRGMGRYLPRMCTAHGMMVH